MFFLHLSFPERMLLLSFTENGEVPTILLVMTLFGECIQLEFSPNYFRDSHLGFQCCVLDSTYIVRD